MDNGVKYQKRKKTTKTNKTDNTGGWRTTRWTTHIFTTLAIIKAIAPPFEPDEITLILVCLVATVSVNLGWVLRKRRHRARVTPVSPVGVVGGMLTGDGVPITVGCRVWFVYRFAMGARPDHTVITGGRVTHVDPVGFVGVKFFCDGDVKREVFRSGELFASVEGLELV